MRRSIKEEVKRLWRLCFDDTEAFIKLYFRDKYTSANNRCIIKDDRVIAALQVLPYEMTFLDTRISTEYISGACTHPAYRKQGLMAQLLETTLAQQYTEKIPLTFLIPATLPLIEYYRRFGFVPAFWSSVHDYRLDEIPRLQEAIRVVCPRGMQDMIWHYCTTHMSQRASCIQHSRMDYRVVTRDLHLAGGNIVSAYLHSHLVGVAFVIPTEQRVIIKDIFTDDPQVAYEIIARCMEYHNKKYARLFAPVKNEEDVMLSGMARFVHLQSILEQYAAVHPTADKHIYLTDEQLPENTAYYDIKEGSCRKSTEPQPNTSYTSLTIGQLTDAILSPRTPFLSLMLN
ncbi:MAG: GNAT family N-acetyltransferase [Prevotellaceae bacterium]|jgi:predicted acetyltransferase|nr:GNAT family N-acetyltransferase [Prevotellaceae bacterium]